MQILHAKRKLGSDHAFMPKRAFLSFDEIEKVVKSCKKLGLKKLTTGGELLLRLKSRFSKKTFKI